MNTETRRFLELLGNDVFEVRAIKKRGGARSGVFDDLDKACKAIEQLDQTGQYHGIYVTINELDEDFSRDNRNKMGSDAAGKADIARRRTVILDIDPERPSGTPATDAQKAAAQEVADAILADLDKLGLPEPLICDSGNGRYVGWRFDGDASEETTAVVQRFLKAMHQKYGTPAAGVDCSVFDLNRIFRISGTMNRKGDSTDAAPHRRASILSVPESGRLEEVSLETLARIADSEEIPEAKNQRDGLHPVLSEEQQALVVDYVCDYLSAAGYKHSAIRHKDGDIYIDYPYCLFKNATDQDDGNFGICVYPDGGINTSCFHRKCRSKTWDDLQELLGTPFSTFVSTGTLEVGGTERAIDDPLVGATKHLDFTAHPTGHPVFAQFGNALRQYDEEYGGWRETETQQLRAEVTRTSQRVFDEDFERNRLFDRKAKRRKTSRKHTDDIINSLSAMVMHRPPKNAGSQFWLTRYREWDAKDVRVFANGFLNVRHYLDGRPPEDYFAPLSPQLYYEHQADFPFEHEPPRPVVWEEFIRSLDLTQEEAEYLQMALGYMFFQPVNLEKFFVFTGPPRSGKGIIGGVLTQVVGGESACCSVNVMSFADKYGLENTLRKRVVFSPEVGRFRDDAKSKATIDIIKSFTGNDPVPITRKYRSTISTRDNGIIVMQTNQLVPFHDDSGAMKARQRLIRLHKSYYGREDVQLADKLRTECPAILHWFLQGLKKLKAKEWKLDMPGSYADILDQLDEEALPIQTFVESCFELDDRYATHADTVFAMYERFSDAQGFAGEPMNKKVFGMKLREAVPAVQRLRMSSGSNGTHAGREVLGMPASSSDTRPYIYAGLKPHEYALEDSLAV